MKYYTLNDLKTEAKGKGWNFDSLPWRKCDWPIADQYLQYEKRINTTYRRLLRDINSGPSQLDTLARFKYKDSSVGSYQYVTVIIQAGLRYGQTETITFSGAGLELENTNGNYSPAAPIEVTYDKPFIELSVRYFKQGGTTTFTVSSPSFTSTFADGQEGAPVGSYTICGNFICGQALVGYTL